MLECCRRHMPQAQAQGSKLLHAWCEEGICVVRGVHATDYYVHVVITVVQLCNNLLCAVARAAGSGRMFQWTGFQSGIPPSMRGAT